MRKSLIDMKQWCHLMGQDLRKSDLQPLQPVRINKNGAIKINVKTRDALGFSASDRVGVELRNGQCLLRKQPQGGVPFKAGKPLSLTVSEEIMKTISSPGAGGTVLIGREGEGIILPVTVEKYSPDLLGPRFIDELRNDCVVRHAVPGLSRDDWTPESNRARSQSSWVGESGFPEGKGRQARKRATTELATELERYYASLRRCFAQNCFVSTLYL